jgi:ribosomal protein S18 acetylase RimI-like enzyme
VRGWEITKALPADSVGLARILGDWIVETGWMPVLHDREANLGFLSGLIDSHECRAVRSDTGLLGFLARREGHIDAIYIAPAARGKGIGAALIAEVKAAEAEIELWTFQANTQAIEFYLREGFREVERTDGSRNDERLPDLRLIWRSGT